MEIEGSKHIHKHPPPFPILSQINPVHNSSSHFCTIHFNFILPSKPMSSKQSLFHRSPNQNLICISSVSHTCHTTCPPCILYLIILIIFAVIYWSYSSSLPSLFHSRITSSALGSNAFITTLFSKTHSMCPSLHVRPRFRPIQREAKL